MRCPKCGVYGFDWEDRCSHCGYSHPSQRPPAWWGRKDFQRSDKTPEMGQEDEHMKTSDSSEVSEPELHDCPHCNEHSLFWNQHTLLYECLNIRCRRRVTVTEFKTKKEESTTAQQSDEKQRIEVPPASHEEGNIYWDTPHDLKHCPIHNCYYKTECEFCRKERQVKRPESTDRKQLQTCPACRQTSLYWNKFTRLYECFNPSCKRDFTRSEFEEQTGQRQLLEKNLPPEKRPSEILQKCPVCGQGMLRWNPSISKYECLNWKCRRTITKEYLEFVQVTKPKRRLQLPRFNTIYKISVGLLVVVIFAFVLLYGLTDFGQSSKSVISGTSPTPSPGSENTAGLIPTPTPALVVLPTSVPLPTLRPIITPRVVIVTPKPLVTPAPASSPMSEFGWVWVDSNTYIVGADGEPIVLVNNPHARNPSWSQLVSFLRIDPTDRMCYDNNSFVCADFAEMLHNNAEKAGWRAAYVSIALASKIYGHALNAFETTDRGLVYIDSTGLSCAEPRPQYMDSRVDLRVGAEYIPVCIFPEPGWLCESPSMGLVTKIEVVQW